MKKIAILRCLRAEHNCTGALCLKVFNGKKDFFEQYQHEDVQLAAFMTCNGCEKMEYAGDAGMQEKLERIINIGTDIVHIGMCCETRTDNEQRCPKIEQLGKFFTAHHIQVVWGTHK